MNDELSRGVMRFSRRIDAIPVIHGSGDFAVAVREQMLSAPYDCIAVPLPGSWQEDVLAAIDLLPALTAVVQAIPDSEIATYVPVDPCQPVIAALRSARVRGTPIAFIDLECAAYEPAQTVFPDPYALKGVPLARYASALLPSCPPPEPDSQRDRRIRRTAFELHRLELDHRSILFVCAMMDWPWIRHAYRERLDYPEHEVYFSPVRMYEVAARTAAFFLGELPCITGLYEQSRRNLDTDENLSIDGIKHLLLTARDRWRDRRASPSHAMSPQSLGILLRYIRNRTLMDRRLTPDLYTLVSSAKQVGGDGFAICVLEAARKYAIETIPTGLEMVRFGLDRADLGNGGVVEMRSRLPGPPIVWRSLELRPDPPRPKKLRYQQLWNPFEQCSYPPEDEKIESFRTHVHEQARLLLGQDLVRTEKFTTSVRDGIDLRETIRHWHTGDLYVKIVPPSRGSIEIVVFLFDVPADPQTYSWRITWGAEHAEESTLVFYARDFHEDLVGPGIARSQYGGVLFIFPPRIIPEAWSDPVIPRQSTLEEQLLAVACYHSRERTIAVVSPCPLQAKWRRIARDAGKKLIGLPLRRFSESTIERIRTFHVLNGRHIRSYASSFIRDY